jgi:hypothetical protein
MTPGRARRRSSHRAVALVWCLALVALLHAGGSLPHVHVGDGPGYYDLDHDLGYLATLGLAGPVPEVADATPCDRTAGVLAVDRGRGPAAALIGCAASRAPPRSSPLAS